jgi:uncharacterized protein YecA (UPF0149 family)
MGSLEASVFEQREGRKLAPLSKVQASDLQGENAVRRKNYMRNQPCVCGSGTKFKRCCWNKYA